MPKKKQPAPKPPVRRNEDDRAFLTREAFDSQPGRHEQAWRKGSVPALVDALILCHQSREPIPLWLVQGAIELIKRLFTGKTLNQQGRLARATTRHRSYLVDYARWDAVTELADRRDEMLSFLDQLSRAERTRRPQFAALAQDYTLDQRCAAVAELFDVSDDPAKGGADTILRSYKRVKRDMGHGKSAKYWLPDRQNPLSSTYNPF